MKPSSNLIFILVLLVGSPLSISSQLTAVETPTSEDLRKVQFYTEEYPPYNYTEDGQLTGIAVDILREMKKRLNISPSKEQIKVLPWARGYKVTLTTPFTCLFTMTGTAERKKLFKLIGPMPKFDSAFIFARTGLSATIASLKDLSPYTVGVLRDDIAEELLISGGVKKSALISHHDAEALVKMLALGRVDFLAYGEVSVPILLRKQGADPSKFPKILSLKSSDSYFAFSKTTPDPVVNRFQKVFDQLREEGVIERLIQKYLRRLGS